MDARFKVMGRNVDELQDAVKDALKRLDPSSWQRWGWSMAIEEEAIYSTNKSGDVKHATLTWVGHVEAFR